MFEKLIEKDSELRVCVPDIQRAFEILARTYAHGGKVLVCGNGGSAADSEHIVGELMKGYLLARPVPEPIRRRLVEAFPKQGAYLAGHLQGALPTLSLVSQTSLLTAFANDVAPDMAFAQQVYGYGKEGDAVIGISTSGRSENVLNALRVARALGLATIGFTGKHGGEMPEVCEVTICVPWDLTADVQERHLSIYHALCALLEEEFFQDRQGL